jgi:DNA-binding response OmpR family regulator
MTLMELLLALGGFSILLIVLGLCMLARRPQPGAVHAEPEILVVDDNPYVLDVIKLGLEEERYKVHLHLKGKTALEFFQGHSQEISAVLLDYMMPEMNGAAVFDELRRINPGVPVILITGFCDDAKKSEHLVKNVAGFLVKPFKLQELVEIVRVVISHAAAKRASKAALPVGGGSGSLAAG